MRDSEELMDGFRTELRRAVQQRFKRVDLDRFKQELKEHITHYLFEQTNRSPIVIPVVNVINNKNDSARPGREKPKTEVNPAQTPEQIAVEQQRRFAEMRAALLNQDQQD